MDQLHFLSNSNLVLKFFPGDQVKKVILILSGRQVVMTVVNMELELQGLQIKLMEVGISRI